MNSVLRLARRTVFQPTSGRLLLTRGAAGHKAEHHDHHDDHHDDHGHGHGHSGPEYGFSTKTQNTFSFITKIIGVCVFAYVPFAAIAHQKAKKAAADA